MIDITVKINPIYEVMSRKLFGIESVPIDEKQKMIKRAVKAGSNEILKQYNSNGLYTIDQIKSYMNGWLLVGDHRENDMLYTAIDSIDDVEDGIDAVIERNYEN